MSWDQARIAVAKRAFADGLTGSETAALIGGITRNTVIGFWNRNGMKRGQKAAAPKPPRPMFPRNNNPLGFSHSRMHIKTPAKIVAEKPQPVTQHSRPIKFMDLPELSSFTNRCRWPLSGKAGPDLICCGADIKHSAYDDPYCQFHRGIATPPGGKR